MDLVRYVHENRPWIIDLWKKKVLSDENIPHAKKLETGDLTVHLNFLLDYFTGILENEDWTPERQGWFLAGGSSKIALKSHTRDRCLKYRYTIPETLMEMSHLRTVLIESVGPQNPSDDERARLNQSLDACMIVVAHECYELTSELENRLIGIVSHDLRNPIGSAIFNMKVMLSREHVTDSMLRSALERALRSSERALKLIEDLLEFSQARVGIQLPVHFAFMDLKAVVEEMIQEHIFDRPIYVNAEGDFHGVWDPERMAQVVSNLLSNAIKHSPAGSPIWIELNGGEDQVILQVTNLSQPIKHPEEIFEAFHQKESLTRSKGVGLGLYIVRHVVNLHKGSIKVINVPSEGKVSFKIILPRDASRATAVS